ncbi:MAG TPA: LysR family transcriptional regulator [Dehalococcoidia bacterium]|nr:LysR family transcriptional regulator [Dehalococcoidia bacterium]
MESRKKKTGKVVKAGAEKRSRVKYRAQGKVWMEKEGEVYMGWGRVELLERIGIYGSIAAAARSMNMSYRNAWLEVDEMNRLAPTPLVEKETGGVGGGNARLTAEGQGIIEEYNELTRKFHEFLKRFA